MFNAVNTTSDRAVTALERYCVHCDFYALLVSLINDGGYLFYRVLSSVLWAGHIRVEELNPVRTLIHDAINRGPQISRSFHAKVSSPYDRNLEPRSGKGSVGNRTSDIDVRRSQAVGAKISDCSKSVPQRSQQVFPG